MILELSEPQEINQVVIKEDISNGHSIRQFKIEGYANMEWTTIYEGTCIGHKAILIFDPVEVEKIKLTLLKVLQTPYIKQFAVYHVKPLPKKLGFFKKIVRWSRLLRSLKTILM